MITIEQPGLLSTLQDRGRFGMRHLGIPWSGCLVPHWQHCANALVSNPIDYPVVESWEGGLSLRVGEEPVQLAMCAEQSAQLIVSSGETSKTVPAFCSFTAPTGAQIQLKTSGAFRHVVIAIAGLKIKPHLSSCSTYGKAGLGGLNGDVLRSGDQLQCDKPPTNKELVIEPVTMRPSTEQVIRVVLGPQLDHFSDSGVQRFLNGIYRVSAEADRMGARLEGPEVTHLNAKSKDIVSDAIVPGSIQIPGNCQPIVLLNDAHTAGGYPKIATVISVDLPWLGLLRQGTSIRFQALHIDAALDVSRTFHQTVQTSLQSISPKIVSDISNERLFSSNLIDGVTNGLI